MTRLLIAGVIVFAPLCGDSEPEDEYTELEIKNGTPEIPEGDRNVDGGGSDLLGLMSPGGTTDERVPTQPRLMERFLVEQEYRDFGYGRLPVRSGVHGDGRAYLNDVLVESLESERGVTTPGAAIVLELTEEGIPAGWVVMRKETRSSQPVSWYFYEAYVVGPEGEVVMGAEGLGAQQCASCHVDGDDYLLGMY